MASPSATEEEREHSVAGGEACTATPTPMSHVSTWTHASATFHAGAGDGAGRSPEARRSAKGRSADARSPGKRAAEEANGTREGAADGAAAAAPGPTRRCRALGPFSPAAKALPPCERGCAPLLPDTTTIFVLASAKCSGLDLETSTGGGAPGQSEEGTTVDGVAAGGTYGGSGLRPRLPAAASEALDARAVVTADEDSGRAEAGAPAWGRRVAPGDSPKASLPPPAALLLLL